LICVFPGAFILGGNDARCVVEIFFWGGEKKSLEILYNAMQRSVKNLVHKGIDFYAQNALKLTYEHL